MLFCSIEFVLFSILSATQKTKTKNSTLTKKLSEMRPSQIILKKKKNTINKIFFKKKKTQYKIYFETTSNFPTLQVGILLLT